MTRPVYDIENLHHAYGSETILRVDRFSVREASIIGLVGPNGSGKTTLLKLLGFIEKPSGGRLLFNGRPAGPFDPAIRFQVALLPQEPYLLKRSVFQNVAYGLKIRGDGNDLERKVYDALAIVGLPGTRFARRKWYELSGGETQRVALAARMVLDPSVLLLDEPTASVDAESMLLIRDAALQSRQSRGTTLLVASHDRQWLQGICDEIVYLFKGQILRTTLENMFFGPWIRRRADCWQKVLSDGQCLMVPPPPTLDAAAVIDPHRVEIFDPAAPPEAVGRATLSGELIRLSRERNGTVLACVSIGNISISAAVSPSFFSRHPIYPGNRVGLFYESDAVQWI